MALVDRTGSGLFVPISVVYLHRTVGLSLTDIGLVLTVAGLIGTMAPLVAGRLLRRYDARWVVAVCFVTCAAALAGYAQARSFVAVLAAATVLQVASRMERPGTALLALRLSRDGIGVLALSPIPPPLCIALRPCSRGSRLVAAGWVRSFVRDPAHRELLFDLDTARRRLFDREGKSAEADLLAKCTANLATGMVRRLGRRLQSSPSASSAASACSWP